MQTKRTTIARKTNAARAHDSRESTSKAWNAGSNKRIMAIETISCIGRLQCQEDDRVQEN
jgi:hypothetical protein